MAGDCKKIKNSLNCDKGEFCVLFLGRQKTNRVCTKLEPEAKLKSYYYGYKGCRNMLLKYINADKNASIAITDDFGLQMIQSLQKQGYKNFTIIITDQDANLAKRFAVYIKQAWKDELKGIDIKLLEECTGMKFDLIISNPPYEVGNEITRRIIDTIDYDQFLNLMPLSKYKKGRLYNFVEKKLQSICLDDVEAFDAYTAPDLCLISKTMLEYGSYDQFELRFYYDQRLRKFWDINSSRERTYLKHIYICASSRFNLLNSKTSFACGIYTPHDKVHAILSLKSKFNSPESVRTFLAQEGKKVSRDCSEEYIWNFYKPDCPVEKCFAPVTSGPINQIFTIFKTEREKDNFVKWWYSAELAGRNPKSGLASILLAGLNKPTDCPFDQAIPNVDWSREWTDEEILKDYGYPNEEIKNILKLGENNLYRKSLLDFQN